MRSEAPKSAKENHLKKVRTTRTWHYTTVGPHLFGPWDAVRYILHGAVTGSYATVVGQLAVRDRDLAMCEGMQSSKKV